MKVLVSARAALIVLITVLSQGCSTVYRFPSPDGTATVLLKARPGVADSSYRLTLDEGLLLSAIELAPVKDDCWLSFAHAAWSPDSTRVAVYFGDALCGNTWVAYDRRRRQFLSFESLSDVMRRSLIETYSLDDRQLSRWGGDPLRWMQGFNRGGLSDDPARDAFTARLLKNQRTAR